MTIQSVVELAYRHLQENTFTTEDKLAIIKRHAMEELEMNEADAEAFALKDEPDLEGEIDSSGFEKFYLWYYFNYVEPPKMDHAVEAAKKRQTSKGKMKFRYGITFYLVFKMKASVPEMPVEQELRQWSKNFYYDIAGSDQFAVVQSDYFGITLEKPQVSL